MLSPENLYQIFVSQNLIKILGALPIVFLITKNQIEAIIKRDNNQCQFPYSHQDSRKLGVHHISNKSDTPENLITVCKNAHLNIIHKNGHNSHDQDLLQITQNNTQRAQENG